MMRVFDITQIMVAFIGLICAVISAFLLPLIKAKLGETRTNQLKSIALLAVRAAEQLGFTGVIKDKFAYAKAHITRELEKMNIVFDDHAIRDAIEAAVIIVDPIVPTDGTAYLTAETSTLHSGSDSTTNPT